MTFTCQLNVQDVLEEFQTFAFLIFAFVHGEEEGDDAEAAQQEGPRPQAQAVAASLHFLFLLLLFRPIFVAPKKVRFCSSDSPSLIISSLSLDGWKVVS